MRENRVKPFFSARLSYFNLKPSVALNALSMYDLEGIWIPEITFANTEGNQVKKVKSI